MGYLYLYSTRESGLVTGGVMVTAYRRWTPDSKVASLTTGRSTFSQLQPLASSSVYSFSTWVIPTFLWRVSQWVAVYMAVRVGTVQRIHVKVKLASRAILFRVSQLYS